jgi:hypothetical protein
VVKVQQLAAFSAKAAWWEARLRRIGYFFGNPAVNACPQDLNLFHVEHFGYPLARRTVTPGANSLSSVRLPPTTVMLLK